MLLRADTTSRRGFDAEAMMVEIARNPAVSKVEPNKRVRAILVPNDTR